MVGRVFTVDRIADLTNKELDEVCGTVTVARGLAYAKHGHVVDLDVSDDGRQATGWVGGSDGQTYTTRVTLTPVQTPAAGRLDVTRWDSTCTCPVSGDCKHAVAVAATVRERQPVLDRLAGRPRRRPAPPGSAPSAVSSTTPTPSRRTRRSASSSRRRARPREAAAAEGTGREQLRIRPVVPGVRGAWIRTGVSWESFAGGYYGFGRGRSPTTTATPSPRSPTPTAARCAPSATAACPTRSTSTTSARAGSRCCAPPTAPGCACSPTSPARARWRSRPTRPSSSSRSCAPTTAPSCTRASSCRRARRETRLVGQPATGFWLRDGSTLVLGALAEPLDGTRQRLLDLGTVEVPEADWARFTVTHLPGLRRKARVRSLSGDLELPDAVAAAAGPARHLRAGSPRAPGGVPVRLGSGGVLVPLASEEPDPMRDRAAERALVDSLLAVDEVAGFDALWQVVARSRRLVPETRLHGFATVAFAELMPVLEEVPDLELTVVGEPASYSEAVDAPSSRCRRRMPATTPRPTGSTSASR